MEEKKQPMPPQHPARVLEKMEKRRQQKKKLKWLLPVAALVTVLVVALGIWIGIGNPDAWKTNILRSDEIPFDSFGQNAKYLVFGSNYQRHQISAVTFLDTLSGAPADAWDVSEAGDGSVMAWVEPDGELYRLTITGEGGVSAGTSCADLFSGYTNMTRISFDGNFHTDAVQDMNSMFNDCYSLTSLDLSSFDTAAVQDISWMFGHCSSLTSLDLSSFNTAAVQDMSWMFWGCEALTSLDLGEKFVTTNAGTGDMFFGCPAGEKYQHLLNN